ncbi:MAG: bifunctional riboflavin kinase/FAD synthetase [Leucobacter sp.]
MHIYESLQTISHEDFARGSVVAIGKFDGVHLGHQAILERMRHAAEGRDLDPVVFTFLNNPLSLLRPDLCPLPLMSRSQRLSALEDAGAAACVMVEFNEEFSQMSAEMFINRVLVEGLRARHVVLGSDFRFGHGGVGDVELLRRAGVDAGFTVEVVDTVDDPELGRVSSTRVREAISQGEVDRATRLLGRAVSVRGEVVRGDARGRDLGFPTANLGGEIEGLVPADGVYAGWVVLGDRVFDAAISVGTNPTFTPDGQPRVEAFLLDFSESIYGQRIEVRFARWLRGMYTFAGIDELIERMHEDVRETRAALAEISPL